MSGKWVVDYGDLSFPTHIQNKEFESEEEAIEWGKSQIGGTFKVEGWPQEMPIKYLHMVYEPEWVEENQLDSPPDQESSDDQPEAGAAANDVKEKSNLMIKAYRVEDPNEGHGIWRNFDGTFNPIFTKLTDGLCKDLPMEDSDFYREDGKHWFSATDTPKKLKAWFSARDVIEMEQMGYKTYEFDITEYRTVNEYEIVFTRESIVNVREVDPVTIWGEEYTKLKE